MELYVGVYSGHHSHGYPSRLHGQVSTVPYALKAIRL